MNTINYNGYLITEQGRIFELCTNKEMVPTTYKTGKQSFRLDGKVIRIEQAIAEVLLGEAANSALFECAYIRGFVLEDVFNNVKIHLRSDKKNKSGRYVALHNGQPYYFENNKPIHKSVNIRLELNIQ